MNKIGFKNFRRFTDFPALEYSGITFLVGRNNAGKSTLVKALLLLNDFFKSNSLSQFSFGNNVLEDANIVTYGRAKNKTAKEDFIQFFYQNENYQTELILTGEEDETHATVFSFKILDIKSQLEFHFKSADWSFTISRQQSEGYGFVNPDLKILEGEIDSLKSFLERSNLKKTSKEYLSIVEEYNALKGKLEVLTASSHEEAKPTYTINASFSKDFDIEGMLGLMLHSAEVDHESDYHRIQKGEGPVHDFEVNRAVYEDTELIESSFQRFFQLIKSTSVIYLGANSSKQSALFPIRDRSNPLAQAIHEYYQLRIEAGTIAHDFVLKWMGDEGFGVGDTFEINLYAGEAYEVLIKSNGIEVPLADKGMGSIQAMLLIFRVACIIDRFSRTDNVTIVIEEPELNLHPALQSKLADLFLDVHDRFRIDFLIETHSEYAIRRSQVIVAEKDMEIAPNENPFKVYYFPSEASSIPYVLNYRPDGALDKNFGEGFFDEASKRTLELLKLKRQKGV